MIALAPLLFVASAATEPLVDRPFRLDAPAEAVLTLEAGCTACDWGGRGREAAVLEVSVDGVYSQHVVLFQGSTGAYRMLLGPLGAGEHRLTVSRDAARSAPAAGSATVGRAEVEPIPPGDPRHEAVAEAPVLYARPDCLPRFTDVPLLLYVESTGGGGREERRYTYVFSNEDGGTPPDRLMATWGRVTDIEEAFTRVAEGGLVRETIQAKDHVVRPFVGERLGRHPVLYVATRNNMFADRGKRTVRLAPAPEEVDLRGTSREAVMDARPWTYDVSAREVRREGRVSSAVKPRRKRIPDPARFVAIEACGGIEAARVALDVELDDGRRLTSDARSPEFRIARSGCFRGAIALPAGAGLPAVRAVRVRAHAGPPPKGSAVSKEPPLVRIDSMNRLVPLADPAAAVVMGWRGPATLAPEGPPLVVAVP